MKLARDEILVRGIKVKGCSWALRQGESLIKKYIDRPEIGPLIQSKLKFLDISKDRLYRHTGKQAGGFAYWKEGKIEISNVNADNRDWLEWAFGHEMWHLTGSYDEIACDDFADKMIYPRPKYRYSKEQLAELEQEKEIIFIGLAS